MKKIICIGNASYDITFPLETFPIENTKNRINSMVECGGGPAANAAYLLGKWGEEVYFAGAVGNDIYGNKIINELKNVNVNIDYIEKLDNIKTTLSCIIVGNEKSSRTTLTYRDKQLKMSKKINIMPDIILVDGQELDVSIEIIKNNPSSISIIDAGRASDNVIELCKYVNYIICSKDFAQNISDTTINLESPKSIEAAFKRLYEMFPNKIYVITLEDKGALFTNEKNQIRYMPTLKKEVIDTTGAGDIFHGAFTYGVSIGYSIENCVKLGNIAGALSTTKLGSKASIPELREVMMIYEK